MPKKLTQKEFIERSIIIHNNKYDYSKVEYKNSSTKVCIICPEHGEFLQLPNSHLQSIGCPKCGDLKKGEYKKSNTDNFINRAKEVHGDKYDYSKSLYKGVHDKICIICPEHGEFWQEANNHLHGQGCPKCKYEKLSDNKKYTTEQFILKAREIHGWKYDYSKVDYKDSHTKVCIICPIHGEFWQKPDNHLNGWGCKKCGNISASHKTRKTTEEFIKRAKEVHGDKYDYSKVVYKNDRTKICIICHEKDKNGKEHGEFFQTPNNHYKYGCYKCSESHLETNIARVLDNNNIIFEREKTFDWLKYEDNLYLDFYLPEYNVAIECQGIQHFVPTGFGCKNNQKIQEMFNKNKKRDSAKEKLCLEHNIKILYYGNYSGLIQDENELIKKIKMGIV